MTGNELSDKFHKIVSDVTRYPDSVLTADQLCTILDEAHTMVLNHAHVAPCNHHGSRYRKEGEELDYCGVCGRQVAEYYSDSLSEA